MPFEYAPPEVTELDLSRAGISTVLWTTGYVFDYRWIELPIFDSMGFPRQTRGVTEVPGLYFIGSLWQHTLVSATLLGVDLDARALRGADGTPLARRDRGGKGDDLAAAEQPARARVGGRARGPGPRYAAFPGWGGRIEWTPSQR